MNFLQVKTTYALPGSGMLILFRTATAHYIGSYKLQNMNSKQHVTISVYLYV